MDLEFGYKKYFGTFEELKDTLDQRETFSHLSPKDCIVARAAVYLLWCGLSKERITEIRYKHLSADGIYDEATGHIWTLPKDGIKFLIDYANDKANFGYFGPEGYLLRTAHTRHLETNTLYGVFSRVNADIPGDQKGLYPMPIYESGVFSRVWERQKDGLKLPVYRRNRTLTDEGYAVYEEVFERSFVSKNAISAFVRKYRLFVDHFYK